MASKHPAKVLCKYYMSNCCFKGDLCPFSHNWDDKPDTICRYYLKGACINGKNCRYDHVRPARGAQQQEPLAAKQSTSSQPSRVSVPKPVNLPSLSSTTTEVGSGERSHHAAPPPRRQMVTLRDDPSRNPKKWVQAAEFVPGKLFHGHDSDDPIPSEAAAAMSPPPQVQGSYSGALGLGLEHKFLDVISKEEASSLLCPFAEMGHCPIDGCEYLHGDVCDMCNRQCLNPFDPEQQKAHRKECLEMHEMEMEKAFQVQESQGKQCAICMEHVVSKTTLSERRFGILANCDHCFCLSCIRKWRGSTHTANKTIRACPLCRKVSYYIVPSDVWIEDEKQKEKLMQAYKDNLGKKHCKYFSHGEGTCPFGSSCFYKHEYPDGRKAVETPRFYETGEGERRPVRTNMLWDFFNNREEETLESLQDISTSQEDEAANERSRDQQDLFWLNYEPDVDDLDFL